MVDETRRCIREGMLSLLDERAYNEITMKEIAVRSNIGRRTLYRYFDNKESIVEYIAESLMDHFAVEIENEASMTLNNVIHAFFVFMHNNRREFLLLKKARLLSYIEDRFPQLIAGVAAKTKYKGQDPAEVPFLGRPIPAGDKYFFYFVFSGFWHVAVAWLEEDREVSPETMTDITLKIMRGEAYH